MFVISNTRYPVAAVKLRYPDGQFYNLSRGWNDMWAANGGPFTFPITIQACSRCTNTETMSGEGRGVKTVCKRRGACLHLSGQCTSW